jgi:hypothetical protein
MDQGAGVNGSIDNPPTNSTLDLLEGSAAGWNQKDLMAVFLR